jgi:hypothetical protein
MGMYVSELRSVPIGTFTYYLYLVDVSGNGEHSAAIAGALQELAVKSGTDALVVRGPANLSAELLQFLNTNAASDFGRLERLFHEVSSLVISKGALQTTNSEVFVVPLIVGGETGETARPLLTELVAGLLAAMRDNRVPDFCRSLGAETLQLATLKDGLFVATLRNVNKYFELKPGVAGLGVNLNAVIERIVGSPTRSLSQ